MAESFHACLHDLQSMGGRRRLVLPFVGRSQHNLQDNIMHVKCHKITPCHTLSSGGVTDAAHFTPTAFEYGTQFLRWRW